jgi:hypothetical protein
MNLCEQGWAVASQRTATEAHPPFSPVLGLARFEVAFLLLVPARYQSSDWQGRSSS